MEKGKKGRRPFPVLRPPSSLLKPAYPTTLTAQTAPHHADQPYDRISTTHSTIAARAVSFHGQLLSGVTPLELAQNGLYYKPLGLNSRAACCFACGTTTPLTTFLRAPIEKIPRLHTENCIWQIIYRDLKSLLKIPTQCFSQHLLRANHHLSTTTFSPTDYPRRQPFRTSAYSARNLQQPVLPLLPDPHQPRNFDRNLNRSRTRNRRSKPALLTLSNWHRLLLLHLNSKNRPTPRSSNMHPHL
jgi:hypothetical protein